MLARKTLPTEWQSWNERWGAPYGRGLRPWAPSPKWAPKFTLRQRGPFSIQTNNDTRRFEYPWAFFSSNVRPGMRTLEVGGGLSGFQFVLSQCGAIVENVDPGMEAKGKGWVCTTERIEYLNSVFGTSVKLHPTTIETAPLDADAFDMACSISVLEHLDPLEYHSTLLNVFRALKPGGVFVLTTDLFLDIRPFTPRESNRYGRNIDLYAGIRATDFIMRHGVAEELNGFPGFDASAIQSRLSEFLIGTGYPTLVQTLILERPV